MSTNSKIEWTDDTWNPIVGCSDVSSGCANCYAKRTIWRLQHNPHPKIAAANAGLTQRLNNGVIGWTGEVNCLPERLDAPLHWKQPRRIFVNSQSDLFHPNVPVEFIDKVFAVMALCPQHTFQVLTKRPERMADYCNGSAFPQSDVRIMDAMQDIEMAPWRRLNGATLDVHYEFDDGGIDSVDLYWPLPNVWLGTSCEDQTTADERIPHLLKCSPAVLFLSCEPLLNSVDITPWLYACPNGCTDGDCCTGHCFAPSDQIGWVIVGGESGPGARACHVDWLSDLVQQCRTAQVPVFVKQLGSVPVMDEAEWRALNCAPMLKASNHAKAPTGTVPLCLRDKKGGEIAQFPEHLRVREFPEISQ